MALAEPLTLYTAKICPFAQRVELALAESGLKANKDFIRYEIDLKNKPEWYQPQINPASKVPAVAYGGPKVPGDQPSQDSTKIAESLVLLEFVADLFPQSHLLPKDPVQRAQTRFFIDAVSTKFLPANFAFQSGKASNGDSLLTGIEQLQALLPKGEDVNGKFAIGDGKYFTIADAAIVPFFARLEVALKNDYGLFPEGEGKRTWERIQNESRFERWRKYWDLVTARESFKNTFDEEYLRKAYSTKRAAAAAAKA